MQVSAPARMDDATFHTAAARLLEVAAVALVVPAVLELWAGYRFATGVDELGAGPSGTDAFSWSRLAQATTIFTFRGPIALLVAAGLLLVLGAVIGRAVPGPAVGALRREAAAVGGLVGVFALFHLVAGTAFLLTAEPDPGAPGFARVQEYGALPFPLVTVLLCGLFFLWWLRIGVAKDEQPAATPDDPASATDDSASAGADEPGLTAVGRGTVEPVDEWISSDGSSANGFDEYFRRR